MRALLKNRLRWIAGLGCLCLILAGVGCTSGSKMVDSFDSSFFNKGGIRVKSEPSGATLYVNEKKIGRAPLMEPLEPGIYRLVAKKRGYPTIEQWVTVPEGKTLEINLKLEAKQE